MFPNASGHAIFYYRIRHGHYYTKKTLFLKAESRLICNIYLTGYTP